MGELLLHAVGCGVLFHLLHAAALFIRICVAGACVACIGVAGTCVGVAGITRIGIAARSSSAVGVDLEGIDSPVCVFERRRVILDVFLAGGRKAGACGVGGPGVAGPDTCNHG